MKPDRRGTPAVRSSVFAQAFLNLIADDQPPFDPENPSAHIPEATNGEPAYCYCGKVRAVCKAPELPHINAYLTCRSLSNANTHDEPQRIAMLCRRRMET